MATEIKVTCDICKGEINKIHANNQQSLTVIFTTEQTEGRSTKSHLSTQKLDWCIQCESIMLKGNMLFASGAQGYNTYWFEVKE